MMFYQIKYKKIRFIHAVFDINCQSCYILSGILTFIAFASLAAIMAAILDLNENLIVDNIFWPSPIWILIK